MTMQDEKLMARMGIATEHAECTRRWVEEREEKDAAIGASHIAWEHVESMRKERRRARVAAWVGWIVAGLAVTVLAAVCHG